LSLKIEEGFGPNGLGILSVTDVCAFFIFICVCIFVRIIIFDVS